MEGNVIVYIGTCYGAILTIENSQTAEIRGDFVANSLIIKPNAQVIFTQGGSVQFSNLDNSGTIIIRTFVAFNVDQFILRHLSRMDVYDSFMIGVADMVMEANSIIEYKYSADTKCTIIMYPGCRAYGGTNGGMGGPVHTQTLDSLYQSNSFIKLSEYRASNTQGEGECGCNGLTSTNDEIQGGFGAGYLVINAATFVLAGTIHMDGQSITAAQLPAGQAPGGGAGGTITINVEGHFQVSPGAIITANGGQGGKANVYRGYGGGGGRIFIRHDTFDPLNNICQSIHGNFFAYGGKDPEYQFDRHDLMGGPGYILCLAGDFSDQYYSRVHVANDPSYGQMQGQKHPAPALLLFPSEYFILNFHYTFSNALAVAIMPEFQFMQMYFAPFSLENFMPEIPVLLLMSKNAELCLEPRGWHTRHSCANRIISPPGEWTIQGFKYFQRADSLLPMILPEEFRVEGSSTHIITQNINSRFFPTTLEVMIGRFDIVDRSECLPDTQEQPDFWHLLTNPSITVDGGGILTVGTNFFTTEVLTINNGTMLVTHDLAATRIETKIFSCFENCVVRGIVSEFQCYLEHLGYTPGNVIAGGDHAGCGAPGGCRDPNSVFFNPMAMISHNFIGTPTQRMYNRPAKSQQRFRDQTRLPGGLSLTIVTEYLEHHGLITVKGGGLTRDEAKIGLAVGRGPGGSLTIEVTAEAYYSTGIFEASGGEDTFLFPSSTYYGASGGYITYYEYIPRHKHDFVIRNYGSQSVVNKTPDPNSFGAPGITFLRSRHNKYENSNSDDAGVILVQGHPNQMAHDSCLSCAPVAHFPNPFSIPYGLDMSMVTVHFEGYASILLPRDIQFGDITCPGENSYPLSQPVNSNDGTGMRLRRLRGHNSTTLAYPSEAVPLDTDPLAIRSRKLPAGCTNACYKFDTDLLESYYQPVETLYPYNSKVFELGHFFTEFAFIGDNVSCMYPEESDDPKDDDPKDDDPKPANCATSGDIQVSTGQVCEYFDDVTFGQVDNTGTIIVHANFEANYVKTAYGGKIVLRDGAHFQVNDMIFMADGRLTVHGLAYMGGDRLVLENSQSLTVNGALLVFVNRFSMSGSTMVLRTTKYHSIDGFPGPAPGSTTDGPNGGIYGGCSRPPCSQLNANLKVFPYGIVNYPTATGATGYNVGGTFTAAGGLFFLEAAESLIMLNSEINADGMEGINPGECSGSGGAIYIATPEGQMSNSILSANGNTGNSALYYDNCAGGGGRVALEVTERFVDNSNSLKAYGGVNLADPLEIGPSGTVWVRVAGEDPMIQGFAGGQASVILDAIFYPRGLEKYSYIFERITGIGPCTSPLKINVVKADFDTARIASGYCVSMSYDTQTSVAAALTNFRVQVNNLGISYDKRLRQMTHDILSTVKNQALLQKADTSADLAQLSTLLNTCLSTPLDCEIEDCEEVEITPYSPVISFTPGTALDTRVRGVPRRGDMTPRHGAFLQLIPHFFRSSYLLPKAQVEISNSKVVGNSTHCTIHMQVPQSSNANLCSDYIILYS